MKDFKVALVILIFISIALTSCTYKFTRLNEDISINIHSAFDMLPIANNKISQYLDSNKYYLARIKMDLNKEHRGAVEFTFIQDESKIGYIRFDTKENKIVEIERRSYDSKLDDGRINIENWKIDSIQAIKIAEEYFSHIKEFNYKDVILNARSYKSEHWSILLRDTNTYYDLKIEAITGEVIYSNVRKIDG